MRPDLLKGRDGVRRKRPRRAANAAAANAAAAAAAANTSASAAANASRRPHRRALRGAARTGTKTPTTIGGGARTGQGGPLTSEEPAASAAHCLRSHCRACAAAAASALGDRGRADARRRLSERGGGSGGGHARCVAASQHRRARRGGSSGHVPRGVQVIGAAAAGGRYALRARAASRHPHARRALVQLVGDVHEVGARRRLALRRYASLVQLREGAPAREPDLKE